MDPELVRRYFEENAGSWVLDGYDDDGHNYPVGRHRARITLDELSALGKRLRAVDLGCGGGHLACALAANGHEATGVDQSQAMIDLSLKRREALPPQVRERVRFVKAPASDPPLEAGSFDAVTAMGVIGYFDRDEELLLPAARLLKPGGLLLVSCRNRLFNLTSVTHRTVKEARGADFAALATELDELYAPIPSEASAEFTRRVKAAAAALPDAASTAPEDALPPSSKRSSGYTTTDIEPRQHTPKRFRATVEALGFSHRAIYGIHPHLLAPGLNPLLPPQVFNRLSSALEAFERLPVSLVYSSVFIAVFEKK